MAVERIMNDISHIIPIEQSPFVLSIHPGDTIVFQVDQNEFDLGEAQELCNFYSDIFKENNVMMTFKGIEIKGVIKNE